MIKAINSALFLFFLLHSTSEAKMTSLDEIIYTNDGQLCGISLEGDAKPYCIESNNDYESPSWGPDGQSIVALSRDLDGTDSLVLLEPNGKHFKSFKESSGFTNPVWSRDGNFIYAVNSTLGPNIGRWDKNKENFQKIHIRGMKGAFEQVHSISLSPNGLTVAITVEGLHKLLIAELHDDSLFVTSQIPEEFASIGMTVWLDNSRLLFIGNNDDRRADLWELNIKNFKIQIKELSGLRIRDFFAASPDNNSVVVSGVIEGNAGDSRWNLWRYFFHSSELKKLTNGVEDTNPSWRYSR